MNNEHSGASYSPDTLSSEELATLQPLLSLVNCLELLALTMTTVNLLLFLIMCLFACRICECRLPEEQIDVLKDIYYNLNGGHWSNCSWNWTFLAVEQELPPKYCGLYIGINKHYNESDNYQTVWALVFHNLFNVSGYLHPNIALLQDIEEIYIDSAPLITGSIPSSICNLTLLFYISFKDTNLQGFVPECIGYSLPKLKKIQFQNNPYLSFNSSILESFCNHSLEMLIIIIDDIDYYGSIPNCIGNKLLNLIWFNFGPKADNFNGTLPASFNNLTNLQSLSLRSPNLYGTISPSLLQNNPSLQSVFIMNTSLKTIDDEQLDIFVNAFCNLSNLTSIQVTDNPLLDFYIPQCISRLERLIAIYFTLLSEQIPWPSLCKLSNLFRIKIANSSIQQNDIPTCFTNLTENIVYLELGGFQGILPPIMSKKLKLIDVENSSFTGKLSSIFINDEYPDFEVLIAHSNNFYDDNIADLMNKLFKYSPNLQAISIYNNTYLGGKFPEFSNDVYLPKFKILAAQNLDIYGVLPHNLYLGDDDQDTSSMVMLYNNRLSSSIPQNLIQSTNNTHSSLILQGNLFEIGTSKDNPIWLEQSPFIKAHNLYLTDFYMTISGLITVIAFICAFLLFMLLFLLYSKYKFKNFNNLIQDILFLQNIKQIIGILMDWRILALLSALCLFYPWFSNYYVSSPWLSLFCLYFFDSNSITVQIILLLLLISYNIIFAYIVNKIVHTSWNKTKRSTILDRIHSIQLMDLQDELVTRLTIADNSSVDININHELKPRQLYNNILTFIWYLLLYLVGLFILIIYIICQSLPSDNIFGINDDDHRVIACIVSLSLALNNSIIIPRTISALYGIIPSLHLKYRNKCCMIFRTFNCLILPLVFSLILLNDCGTAWSKLWFPCINQPEKLNINIPITVSDYQYTYQNELYTIAFDPIQMKVLDPKQVCDMIPFSKIKWSKCLRSFLLNWVDIILIKTIIMIFMPIFIIILKTLKGHILKTKNAKMYEVDMEYIMITTKIENVIIFGVFCPLMYFVTIISLHSNIFFYNMCIQKLEWKLSFSNANMILNENHLYSMEQFPFVYLVFGLFIEQILTAAFLYFETLNIIMLVCLIVAYVLIDAYVIWKNRPCLD